MLSFPWIQIVYISYLVSALYNLKVEAATAQIKESVEASTETILLRVRKGICPCGSLILLSQFPFNSWIQALTI